MQLWQLRHHSLSRRTPRTRWWWGWRACRSAGWSSRCFALAWSSARVEGRHLDQRQEERWRKTTLVESAKQMNKHSVGLQIWVHLWRRPHSWKPVYNPRWKTGGARCVSLQSRLCRLLSSRTQCRLWCSRLFMGDVRQVRHSDTNLELLVGLWSKQSLRPIANMCKYIFLSS